MNLSLRRAESFSRRLGIKVPVLLAPMAGASPPSLSIAVANAGGMGACGVLLMSPIEILNWAKQVKLSTSGPFQLNNWIPSTSPPLHDVAHERVKSFLLDWGPPSEKSLQTPKFSEQCEAMLEAEALALSSIMGLFPSKFVVKMKKKNILWFANVTTVAEARAAEDAGADVIVAQGAEAGGHRGSFVDADAETKLVGLFSLLPAVVDAVKVPVIAAGGVADGRGVAAALLLGASGVQVGTAFLRSPEAKISSAWADAIAMTAPENTVLTRAFSGRAGRSIATDYVRAAASSSAPSPAPYPIQRELTAGMRRAGQLKNDLHRIQAWAGQSASLAPASPASATVDSLWSTAQTLLS